MFILSVKCGEKLIDNIVYNDIFDATIAARGIAYVNPSFSMAINDDEGNIIYTY